MTQKTLLIISAVLTAFVLVVGGAVAARVSQPPAPVEAAAPDPAAQTVTSPTTTDINAQVEQLMQQREAQYRQLIEEANQRLAQANQQLAAPAQAQSAAPAVHAAQPAQPAQPTASLSAEAARNIAIDTSGGATMIRQPELVLFEGVVAYEIGFTRGVVYVDANSGAVLFNGTHGTGGGGGGGAVAQPSQPQPQTQPSGQYEQEHETESHDD